MTANEQIYEETMHRLTKGCSQLNVSERDAIILLSNEISRYREEIQRLRHESDGLCSKNDYDRVWKNCEQLEEELRICRSDNNMLKDTVVRLAMRLVGI